MVKRILLCGKTKRLIVSAKGKVDSEQLRELHRYLIKKEPQHWMCNADAAVLAAV